MPTANDLKEQGLQFFRAERLPQAAQAFGAAAEAFAAQNDPRAAAEMRNNQCVALLGLQQWAEARAAVESTAAVFRELGDRLREAQAIANLAAADDGAGNVEQAADLYMQAIDIFGELGETETRSACFKKLSALQIKLGLQLQALASMQSGLRLASDLSPKEKTLKGLLDRAMKMISSG